MIGCAGPLGRARRAADDGAYELAARHYREALAAADERDVEATASLWLELGQVELAADRPDRAREAFVEAAHRLPHAARPRVLIGMTHELRRRYDEALIAYGQAVEAAPDSAYAHRVLGSRLLRWGEPGQAVPYLARAVELDPGHAEGLNALAMAQHGAGDTGAAEATFRRGTELHPEHRGLWLGLAAVRINRGDHIGAVAVYDRVIARWPRFAPAHVGRAILLHELGRGDEAEAAFEAAVAVAADPRPYRARLAAYRALRRRLARTPRSSTGSSGPR